MSIGLDQRIFLSLAGPILLLEGCGPAPSDRDMLETLLTFEICDGVSVVNATRDEEVSLFRFDEVYRFQLSGTADCLSEIIDDAKGVFDCEEYPDQLACKDTNGNTAIFEIRQDKIDITYST